MACNLSLFVILCKLLCFHTGNRASGVIYNIDDSDGLGRVFYGIGAISGGGATSKLLVNYPEPERSHVLDFLFKPNFGAGLQILKVEIGGDAQSTEGTECSHMHEPWEENYTRGYEWWMMIEAKKRNPNIKLYGLPWGFPGWLGGGTYWPFHNVNVTADYIVRWIDGARVHYGLDIDYIGLWNEKPYEVKYVLALRAMLDERGFEHVEIVAADMIGAHSWDVVADLDIAAFNKAVSYIGAHYTGTSSTKQAQSSHKPLWASEDYSAYDNVEGGRCIARIANQNYVNGFMSSTIAWNMLASYYNNLPIAEHSLMTANEPWSGHYEVRPPIWAVAHTTQFTEIGWRYYCHDNGVGRLKGGGSYVTLVSSDNKQLTIVIETMDTRDGKSCLDPSQLSYSSTAQNVTFAVSGSFNQITSLNVWASHLNATPQTYFIKGPPIKVYNGKVPLYLEANSVYTLTTLNRGLKGTYEDSPPSKPFPFPYQDDFESYLLNSEANNFAQQVGAFEVRESGDSQHGKVLQQVMISPPIHWCPLLLSQPITMVGNYNWSDIRASVDLQIPATNGTSGAYLAVRVDQGGCHAMLAKGVFVWLLVDEQQVVVATDITHSETIFASQMTVKTGAWYSVSLEMAGNHTIVMVNNKTVFSQDIPTQTNNGFIAVGTDNFGLANFDNFFVGDVKYDK